ncbi:UbiA prenyltransferase family-domain-containing protein [Lentinula raphanica]|nr:UbiA prenyltransferase family-domain-containing protein [Lentinula raphanica]
MANFLGICSKTCIDLSASSSVIAGLSEVPYFLWCQLYTCLLFTWTDYKTIMFPVTLFASAVAPVQSISNLLHGLAWIWIHLLLCNVSNQAQSGHEDSINHPWRPIPSGRLTEHQATRFRWALVLFCTLYSTFYGKQNVLATTALITATIFHDDLGMSGNPLGKNLCNVGGYTSFEFGAINIIGKLFFSPSYTGSPNSPDALSFTAIVISGTLIFTTIHAQDFADVEGDFALGRTTLPICAPELSRLLILLALAIWSIGLGWFWDIHPLCQIVFVAIGLLVGIRYYYWRTLQDDKVSYLLYNVWICCAHILPLNCRM